MTPPTLGPAFARVMVRELDRLVRLLEDYPDESQLWMVQGSARNAPGVLALHLAGNLEYYVGAVLGDTGYERDRDAEFAACDLPRAEVVARIRRCREVVRSTLEVLPDPALAGRAPEGVPASLRDENVTGVEFLAHLTRHLGWHLGQVDYHRRLLVGGESL